MKHIRTRRRFKAILTVCLIMSLLLFIESRIESLLPEVKHFVEARLQELIGPEAKVAIGDMDGGILKPFVLHDVRIYGKDGKSLSSAVDITSVTSNYRIWDVLFRQRELKWGRYTLPAKRPYVTANFTAKDRSVNGYVRLFLDGSAVKAQGSVSVFGKGRVDFSAAVNDGAFEAEIRPASGLVKIKGALPSGETMEFRFRLSHVKLGPADIVCDGLFKYGFPAGAEYAEGELELTNVILNYKPFLDFKTSYRISSAGISVSDLKLGRDFTVNGTVGLKPPHIIDITMLADNVSVSRLLSYFDAQDSVALSGTLNAKFEAKGPASRAKIAVRMDIREGTLATIDFDRLTATLAGEWPVIRIDESRITRPSGYFALEGEMDLRKMGSLALFKDLRLATDDRAVVWDKWGSVKLQDVQELTMRKRMTDDLNIGFKKFIADDRIDESLRQRDQLELEYSLQPNDFLKVEVGQDSNFFGMEHRDKF